MPARTERSWRTHCRVAYPSSCGFTQAAKHNLGTYLTLGTLGEWKTSGVALQGRVVVCGREATVCSATRAKRGSWCENGTLDLRRPFDSSRNGRHASPLPASRASLRSRATRKGIVRHVGQHQASRPCRFGTEAQLQGSASAACKACRARFCF